MQIYTIAIGTVLCGKKEKKPKQAIVSQGNHTNFRSDVEGAARHSWGFTYVAIQARD